MYQANDIAAWFLRRIDREAGDSITHLKLQKLVYYAQSWSLALLDRPLFVEEIEAWRHGPVARSVYRQYDGCGWSAISAPTWEPEIDEETETLLENIHRIYGGHQASELERLSHLEEPWNRTRGNLDPEEPSNRVIPKDAMKHFYSNMFERTGGALVPHSERFEGIPLDVRRAGAVAADEDAEFDRSVMAGLQALYDEFYASPVTQA